MRQNMERLEKLARSGDVAAHVELLRLKIRRGELVKPEPNAQAVRECARCGRPLEDPASRSHGVGPVCRKKTNKAIARQMPSDVVKARKAYGAFLKVLHLCNAQVQYGCVEIGEALFAEDADQRKDWREVVLRMEWVFSFGMDGVARDPFYEVAEALGYDVLVAMWKGMCVMGAASLTFENGVLVLRSPRPNRAVTDTLKYKARGSFNWGKKAWHFHPMMHEEVRAAMRHFLVIDGVEEALEQAKRAPKKVMETPLQAKPRDKAKVPDPVSFYCEVEGGGALVIRTPFRQAFLTDIKELPRGTRRWDGMRKAWCVVSTYAEEARALVRKHFGSEA
jgi:hypothetical protein